MRYARAAFGVAVLLAGPVYGTEINVIEALQNKADLGVKLSVQGDTLVIESKGMPNHVTGNFPMMNDSDGNGRPDNPNQIRIQAYRFEVPLHPKQALRTSPLPMGPVAISLGGAVFYNAYSADRMDAVKSEVFDACKGHPDRHGRYHYHQYSPCVPRVVLGSDGHAGLMGWAFDGFELYGINQDTHSALDACQGHEDSVRGYHYHMKASFPYVMGCYRGTPTFQDGPKTSLRPKIPLNIGSFRVPPRQKGRRALPPPRY